MLMQPNTITKTIKLSGFLTKTINLSGFLSPQAHVSIEAEGLC